MHLLTFLSLKKPSLPLRVIVIAAQGLVFNLYFIAYLLFPKYCHRFVSVAVAHSAGVRAPFLLCVAMGSCQPRCSVQLPHVSPRWASWRRRLC